METIRGSPHHSEQDKDKRLALTVIGSLMLAGGVAAALLGPLEIYCYYLFSPGGPFHYEGFAFGSFMFGNITAQIAGYYLLAIILIPLGYGHLRKRRWIRPVALALLQAWLVVGAPLTLIAAFILAGTKELSPLAAVLGLILIVLVYPLLPVFLIRFYRKSEVRQTLESRDAGSCPLDTLPGPLLTLNLPPFRPLPLRPAGYCFAGSDSGLPGLDYMGDLAAPVVGLVGRPAPPGPPCLIHDPLFLPLQLPGNPARAGLPPGRN